MESKVLARTIGEVTEIAKGFGLDFYPMRYEICPASVIYTFGAYGMPSRFSHWSFGKQYHKMKMQYDLGLSKIYELVVNTNPCYAFLLDTNTLIQNKLIIAHVLAHSDFFKNNVRFSKTNRDMIQQMSATSERIKAYEKQFGVEKVEDFLNAVLAIEEHIDPLLFKSELPVQESKPIKSKEPYSDLWDEDVEKNEPVKKKNFPEQPEKDLMLFIQSHSKELEEWQRDIMTMVREEMLYFWPQLETKILNEGWATYWHQKIMRELPLTEEETIEYAKLNASVIQPSKTSINPYYLGLKLLQDIEKKEENEKKAKKKLFEIRELESDQSFIRNYFTKEFSRQEDLYLFQQFGKDYKITDKDFEAVRDELVQSRVNGGFPCLYVEDGDYMKNGELYIRHAYEGTELDVQYLEKVMHYIYQLWGRTVHFETVLNQKAFLFTCSGRGVYKKQVE
ncbi:SpoVR family protein [Jeotgalibacillus haloalkalitolerans]|uniref:SpoVR family protein n=1 Tax=Jeotgalibacillus haloalkalitolerans TaxID=3104292 RepID=A0ABU5KPN9_9BACL|nr:SpoVR family protein [Jeotgalibacillus sp. HH7-29]MDZ5713114.1 SpoVR family protein [Jeotgalibacillus sp. HH7-29]